ncbi:MAG: arginase family protein [Ferruginibacter sp.]|nr:arginase family protein [Cytophagales bacterium]
MSTLEVPLTEAALTARHGIGGYQPLVDQFAATTALLAQQQPGRLLLLAGDCAAEIAPVAYFNQRYDGQLTVLWLDAHADLNTPASSPSGHFHGMPLRLLLEGEFTGTAFRVEAPLRPGQVLFAGLRDTDPAEDNFIAAHGLPVYADAATAPALVLAALRRQPPANLYIHLDLDVLNPNHFPALQCPVAGGFEPTELAALLRELLASCHVVGLSLTETMAATLAELAPIAPILAVYGEWLANDLCEPAVL